MRLADAFEIELDLAITNTKSVPNAREAIAEVEEFVRVYEFDDEPDPDETIYIVVDGPGFKTPYLMIWRDDLDFAEKEEAAVQAEVEKAGVDWIKVTGWTSYTAEEMSPDMRAHWMTQ